jgi:hypothetical protein
MNDYPQPDRFCPRFLHIAPTASAQQKIGPPNDSQLTTIAMEGTFYFGSNFFLRWNKRTFVLGEAHRAFQWGIVALE